MVMVYLYLDGDKDGYGDLLYSVSNTLINIWYSEQIKNSKVKEFLIYFDGKENLMIKFLDFIWIVMENELLRIWKG